jgi:hypothetical protein
MTSTKLKNRQAATYLDQIRDELADVPRHARDDLLATVRERLEERPDDASPEYELGPARTYARDLRESAGLPPQRRTVVMRLRAIRLRTKVIATLTTLLVIVLVAALVERAHYQPLSAVNMGGMSTAVPVNDNLATGADYYEYQPGRIVVSTIQLQNRGRATVTVDGVAVALPEGPLVVREIRATNDQYKSGTWTLAPKVTHFTVHPGKTMYLFVVMKIVPFRLQSGDSIAINQPALHVRVLGVHHTVTVVGNAIGVVAR